MNRPLIITIGITLLLLMVGLWVYLLAYGAPEKPKEVFSNLGFLSQSTEEVPREVDPYMEKNPGVQLSLGGAALQQLTTRAVAGFTFAPDQENILRYVEKGTGHVYEIDLSLGTEAQVSLTTVPQTTEAVFGPDGSSVILTSYEGYTKNHILGFFDDTELLLTQLPQGIDNIAYGNADMIYFSREENNQTIGYAYDSETEKTSQIGLVPFGSAAFVWGSNIEGIYAHPKPTALLESSVYKVTASLNTVGEEGKGIVAFGAGEHLVVSSSGEEDLFTGTAYFDGASYPQPLAMLPEKCVFIGDSEEVYCASQAGIPDVSSIMNFYKGVETSSDYLWHVDLYNSEANVIANLSEQAGRTLDIDGITLQEETGMLLFRNKLDGALWLYRLPLPTQEE